jgi:hypothetical protein
MWMSLLLAKEEVVLQNVIVTVMEYAVDGSECEKDQGTENLKASIPITDYDRSKTTRECRIFQLFKSMITNNA